MKREVLNSSTDLVTVKFCVKYLYEMAKFSVFLVAVLTGCALAGEKYPSDFQRCAYGNGDCIAKVITDLLGKYSKGTAKLNLLSFDPLRIKTLVLDQNPSSPVNIQLKFTDVDLNGISAGNVYKVVGFDRDPTTSAFEVHLKFPKISLVGPYTVKGQVLILPITGAGDSEIIFDNMDISIKFSPKVTEKNGEKYIEVAKMKMDIKTTKMTTRLNNLFNGDKALGDNMNLFINENWEAIFGELKPAITKAMQTIFTTLMNGPYSKFPYNELYLED